MSEPLQLITTGDGSNTIFVPWLNEHYHSVYGAITESMHVFVEAGFNFLRECKSVSVFEIGFGTGLNALLTFEAAARRKTNTLYHTIEEHPLDKKLYMLLNYADLLPGPATTAEAFQKIHEATWDSYVSVGSGFTLHKIKSDFLTYNPVFHYDIVYFDAFAPAKQPEMWRKEHFKKLYQMLNPGGLLVTYCVQGQVKRNLKASGFYVETLPGPPGKREILRAWKGKFQSCI